MKAFKFCNECGLRGRLSENPRNSDFHMDNGCRDGFKNICKTCSKVKRPKKYVSTQPDKHATQVQIDEIENIVCSELKLDREKMFCTKYKGGRIPEGKHLIWTILKDKYGLRLYDIKREYSVDHTSVIYGIRKTRGYLDVYPDFRTTYNKIMNMTSNKYVLAYE